MIAGALRFYTSPMDELTGLAAIKDLPSAIAGGEAVAAVFLDIDGFRRVNDEHGHLVGDEILRRLGRWLAERAKALHGTVFRVAGDEFVLLLPRRTHDDAVEIATALVSRLPPLPATITFSAVVFAANRDVAATIKKTLDDFAETLYRAELASGRDHSSFVVMATPES